MKTERELYWWEIRDLAVAIPHWFYALRGEVCPDCEYRDRIYPDGIGAYGELPPEAHRNTYRRAEPQVG